MIINTTKNSLVIFSDVQNEYGTKVYNYIKENSDKSVYYIDGNTPTKNRDVIKEFMEEDDTGNTIIVASMQCFSEGIDIANMWNIFLIESTKSDIILAQLLGRGMRRHPKKDKTMMIDFVDDMRFGQGYYSDNYLYRHGKERQSIYKKRGFPYNVFPVELSYTSKTLI
jgi:superfamily II DNA or RNA helicase